MRYPPLMIALFLAMLLKLFAEHFRSFPFPNCSLIILFLTIVYAFRHIRLLSSPVYLS